MDQICAYLRFLAFTDSNSLTLEKKYEDWNEIDFEITLGTFGEHSMQIIKRKKVPTSPGRASQMGESATTDSSKLDVEGAHPS